MSDRDNVMNMFGDRLQDLAERSFTAGLVGMGQLAAVSVCVVPHPVTRLIGCGAAGLGALYILSLAKGARADTIGTLPADSSNHGVTTQEQMAATFTELREGLPSQPHETMSPDLRRLTELNKALLEAEREEAKAVEANRGQAIPQPMGPIRAARDRAAERFVDSLADIVGDPDRATRLAEEMGSIAQARNVGASQAVASGNPAGSQSPDHGLRAGTEQDQSPHRL